MSTTRTKNEKKNDNIQIQLSYKGYKRKQN